MVNGKKQINVNYLYKLNNLEFIQEAFRLLLNREVDQQGLEYYLGRLNAGKSKTSVLIQISSSYECSNSNIVDGYGMLKASQFLSKQIFNKPIKHYARPLRIADKKIGDIVSILEKVCFTNSNNQLTNSENSTNKPVENTHFGDQLISIKSLTDKMVQLESDIIQQNRIISGLSTVAIDDDKKIYLNVTTLKRWRSTPVGIVRTELELAKYLYAKYSNSVFVVWVESANAFFECPLVLVDAILKDGYRDNRSSDFYAININETLFTKVIDIQEGDVFVSVGLDWDHELTQEIYKLKKNTNCKTVLACHDLVPIVYPEVAVAVDFKQKFKKHFVDMFHTADLIWTNSENSLRDLKSFWESDCGLNPDFAPPIKKIYLGSDLFKKINEEILNDVESNQLRHILSLGKFVMYVSSFEPRKNHKLLLDIWREGYKKHGENWPVIVIVGRHGWGSDDLINQMNRMLPKRADKIIWLNNASDNLLSKLYQNVEFTLFPSLYEGWGLAAVESLMYGKPCIVANNSSLVEATQGLMPSFHPLDYPSWQKEIEKMYFDKDYLIKLNKEIKKHYKLQTWNDFSRAFIEEVNTLIEVS